MKFVLVLSVLTLLFSTSYKIANTPYGNVQQQEIKESLLVTFTCTSCKKRNKFYISGPEEHTFKTVKFPLRIKLKSGAYEMTYWQNRVQQIHLPFAVSSDSKNIIIVKD